MCQVRERGTTMHLHEAKGFIDLPGSIEIDPGDELPF
jgi:hypothetical protein